MKARRCDGPISEFEENSSMQTRGKSYYMLPYDIFIYYFSNFGFEDFSVINILSQIDLDFISKNNYFI